VSVTIQSDRWKCREIDVSQEIVRETVYYGYDTIRDAILTCARKPT